MGRRPTGRIPGGLARGGQKGGLKAAFKAEILAEIEALVGDGSVEDWDIEAIETAVRRQAMRVAARAIERRCQPPSAPFNAVGAMCAAETTAFSRESVRRRPAHASTESA